MRRWRLMAVLAHPDDESLGVGGTLAKYASEGVEAFLLTATRGDSGRYRSIRPSDPRHPGSSELAAIREAELRAAAAVPGVHEVSLLDCMRVGHPDVVVGESRIGRGGHGRRRKSRDRDVVRMSVRAVGRERHDDVRTNPPQVPDDVRDRALRVSRESDLFTGISR